MAKTLSIIGTAGREPVAGTLTKDLYLKMLKLATEYTRACSPVILKSGGAAWSDHIAVYLFLYREQLGLQIEGLELHVPCSFMGTQFYDNFDSDWRINPGKVANYYHQRFQAATGIDSFTEISNALQNGAKIVEHQGFHARNSMVAQCDFLLAFSWGISEPSEGGTLDTWRKSSAYKVYVSLKHL